ncbi:MAG: DNA cytosine methyltransferase [Methanomicrobiales archaeon]
MNKSLITLFCGAGGLDLGFHLRKNVTLQFANEILEKPALSYSKNFNLPLITIEEFNGKYPSVVKGDVQKFDFSTLENNETDIVVGGPPCQDFSVLRGKSKRQGITVQRGKLYSHFVRALVHIQPKVFVFENVPGLLTANQGEAYKIIQNDFKDMSLRWKEVKNLVDNRNHLKIEGYEILFSSVINLTDLGVPQARKRIIIAGVRKDLVQNVGDLFQMKTEVEKILKGTDSMFPKYPLTPMEVIEGETLDNLENLYLDVMKSYSNIWKDLKSDKAKKWEKNHWKKLEFNIYSDYKFLNKIIKFSEEEFETALKQHKKVLKMLGYYKKPLDEMQFEDGSNDRPNEQERVVERMKRIPPGANYQIVQNTEWQVKGLMSGVYRRIHPLIPSPTVIAYGGGGTWGYHYKRERAVMTNRERARLQTFPDWYLFEGSRQEVRAQIGEAVPPLASYKIAIAVENVMKLLK